MEMIFDRYGNDNEQRNHLQMHKSIGIICLSFGIDQCRLCQWHNTSQVHMNHVISSKATTNSFVPIIKIIK